MAAAGARAPTADANARTGAAAVTAAPGFVWLASQSPRRAQLLAQLGVAHRALVPADAGALRELEALESPRRGEAPAAYVARVTALKLDAAIERHAAAGLAAAPIVCADTTVAIGRAILGKPADEAEARAMLRRLAGRRHRVLTAVAVADARGRRHAALSVSTVDVAPTPPGWIARYVAGGEPLGKAGAYAIQGAFAARIARIAGSHSGIMGLPLHETAGLLARCGVAV